MSWLDGLVHRVRVRIRREAYAREREEEERFHAEMEDAAERRRAGGSATARPPPDPSDLTPTHDKLPWGRRLVDRIGQDLGYALRRLIRTPGFTAMVLLTLALGIGANSAVFSVLDRIFGQVPAGVQNADGLRRLYVHAPSRETKRGNPFVFPYFSYTAFSAVRDASATTGRVAAWTPSDEETVVEGARELSARVSWVTPDFFGVVGVRPRLGRFFSPEESRIDVPARVAVISHALWERDFGLDPSVLGRTFRVDGVPYTIVGITAGDFAGLDLSRTDVFLPLSAFPAQSMNGVPWYRGFGNYLMAVARLPSGDGRALATRATIGYRRQDVPKGSAIDPASNILLGSIIQARGPEEPEQSIEISTRIAGVSLIVLLIACANVGGLLLVRATARRREIAVRRALGISQARLMGQLLTESVLLAVVSTGVALLVAAWGGSALRRLVLPNVAWVEPGLEARTVLFALATAVVVGLAAGLAPALHARRVRVGTALRSGVREGGPSHSVLRSALVVAQAALSIVLLVGAALFLRSLTDVAAIHPGYDIEHIAFVMLRNGRLDTEKPALDAARETASRIAAVPGVSGVALAANVPMLAVRFGRVSIPGRDSTPGLEGGRYATYNLVSPGFFSVTGTHIIEGRGFEAGVDSGTVVVTERMARVLWPGQDAVGRCVVLDPRGSCRTVVGVVEDVHRSEIIEEPSPQFFRPLARCAPSCALLLRIDSGSWSSIASVVRTEISHRYDPKEVRIGRLSDALDPQLRPWRLGAQLFTALGILALIVTMVGVYSVTAYAVSQRTHEMGVRIALGANLADLLGLVVGEGLRTVALGGVVGVALALALGRLVASLLYGITPHDPASIVAAVLVLLTTCVIASLVPAWRAGRVDPVQALSAD